MNKLVLTTDLVKGGASSTLPTFGANLMAVTQVKYVLKTFEDHDWIRFTSQGEVLSYAHWTWTLLRSRLINEGVRGCY